MTCLSYVYIYIILKKNLNIKGKNNLKKKLKKFHFLIEINFTIINSLVRDKTYFRSFDTISDSRLKLSGDLKLLKYRCFFKNTECSLFCQKREPSCMYTDEKKWDILLFCQAACFGSQEPGIGLKIQRLRCLVYPRINLIERCRCVFCLPLLFWKR